MVGPGGGAELLDRRLRRADLPSLNGLGVDLDLLRCCSDRQPTLLSGPDEQSSLDVGSLVGDHTLRLQHSRRLGKGQAGRCGEDERRPCPSLRAGGQRTHGCRRSRLNALASRKCLYLMNRTTWYLEPEELQRS